MKNLLIYINPEKAFVGQTFSSETDILPKVQIDNSLDLGWKREDILLVTNFPYEYNGVKALVVDDKNYNIHKRTASKIDTIVTLYERGLVNDIMWFHDFDAFQLEKITEEEARGLLKDHDLALTDYGRTRVDKFVDKRWSTGIMFFNEKSKYIFDMWKKEIYNYKQNEEIVFLEMMKKSRNKNIKKRTNRINITYNLSTRKRNILETYKIADKPIKVLHFHPSEERPIDKKFTNIDVCIKGKGKVGKPLVNDRFLKIFNKHYIYNNEKS